MFRKTRQLTVPKSAEGSKRIKADNRPLDFTVKRSLTTLERLVLVE